MPLLNDVKAFIEANVPEASSYSVKLAYKSDSPNKMITIFGTGGHKPPETTCDVDYPSFQISIRGEPNSYSDTYAVAFAVYRALQTNSLVDLDVSPPSEYVYCYSTQSDVMSLGSDHTSRPEFVLNFKAMRTF